MMFGIVIDVPNFIGIVQLSATLCSSEVRNGISNLRLTLMRLLFIIFSILMQTYTLNTESVSVSFLKPPVTTK